MQHHQNHVEDNLSYYEPRMPNHNQRHTLSHCNNTRRIRFTGENFDTALHEINRGNSGCNRLPQLFEVKDLVDEFHQNLRYYAVEVDRNHHKANLRLKTLQRESSKYLVVGNTVQTFEKLAIKENEISKKKTKY